MTNKTKQTKTVGQRMIGGLRELVETLESGGVDAVRQNFQTTRRAKLQLTPTAYDPKKIRATRDLLGLSQSQFASFLGVSSRTVQAWEQGVNEPSQGARRLLDEIRHDPNYWINRLHELMTSV